MNKVPISEIFFSIQGEGIFLGVPQVFVRFSGCNLKKCRFCDEAAVENYSKSVKEIVTRIKKITAKNKIHSVSLTGGEPLLYPDFIEALCVELKKGGFKIYLETNGTLPQELKAVIKKINFTAMDIKLPSATRLKGYFAEHEAFLKIAKKKKVFVKVVVTKDTKLSCFKKAVGLVKKIDKKIPFIIQPAAEAKRKLSDEAVARALLFLNYALKSLEDARVIPQIHKRIGVK